MKKFAFALVTLLCVATVADAGPFRRRAAFSGSCGSGASSCGASGACGSAAACGQSMTYMEAPSCSSTMVAQYIITQDGHLVFISGPHAGLSFPLKPVQPVPAPTPK